MRHTLIAAPEGAIVTARRDLRISPRRERGDDFYFVEDPQRNKFYRLGPAEHAFFAALDGRRTIAEAAADVAASEPNALTPHESLILAGWLVSTGLASTDAGSATPSMSRDQANARSLVSGGSVWSYRISLGSPDAWLAKFDGLGRLLFGRACFVVWSVVVVAALLQVAASWPELLKSSPIDLGRQGAMLLGSAWCGLKVLHELGHGLACRRFGGNVGVTGMAFVLGMPSPFVDVSSISRSPSKWERIAVSLAGVYVELFVAAGAMLLWSATSDSAMRQAAMSTAVVASVASVGTLMFNLNPLMRFDGYFALSDFVEIPNLAAAGREESQRLIRRYLLGSDEPTLTGGTPRPAWVAWYGFAATAWRWSVVASLLLLAVTKLGLPITVLISLPVVAAWFARRTLVPRSAHRNMPNGRRNLVRQLATVAGVAVVVGLLVCWCGPRHKELAAVVDYDPLEIVRAETAGFVRAVLVADGEQVAAGQKLVELENAELRVELARAELAIQQSLIRTRMHRRAGATAKEQAERLQRDVLEAELRELQKRNEQLTIRSQRGGTIVSHGLARALGRRVEQGDELAAIGDDGAKRLLIAVPQRLVSTIANADTQTAEVELSGHRRPLVVRLTSCEPRASLRLLHPALSTEHGGTTIVRRRAATPDELGERGDAAGRDTTIAEAIEPCFTMRVDAEDEALHKIAAGRTAIVVVRVSWRAALEDSWLRATTWLHGLDAGRPQTERASGTTA
jgi:putative peptide zinc metalloprotease protein